MRRSRAATGVAALAVAVVCGTAARAAAAHLELIDKQEHHEESPPTAQQAPCETFGTQSLSAMADPGRGAVEMEGSIHLRSSDPGCNLQITFTTLAIASFVITPDPGDDAALPVSLCIESAYSVFAEATGGATTSAKLGGDPVTMPATVVRDPGSVTLESIGPFDVSSGSVIDGRPRTILAALGDIITITQGTDMRSQAMNTVGVGNAAVRSTLSARIGACAAQGAPASSPTGLALLSVALGAFGALALRRRLRVARR